ncbi:MAG: phosphatidylglycerophosphatase A [Micavibrio aeruginosavorus]|uniref:Phosphatidylglycerophosphatase A n=1 Tax=Micavibrio aeruginosavorus TaxID=349221 RepID=A0A2W5N4J9_9BACT|nr:MAG: phosphatidylglycerophosphatase A [Micavibrio aeruginosavorus]
MSLKIAPPDPELLKKLDFKNPALWVATGLGCGLMRPGPGTWGTLGALPVGVIILALGGQIALLLAIALLIPIGLWASAEFEKMSGSHDNSMIVIDEAAGIWITLLACTLSPLSIILAFLLFRFFDILKPWPVSWLDKNIGGAAGVMLDDIAAGMLGALCLWGIHHYALAG